MQNEASNTTANETATVETVQPGTADSAAKLAAEATARVQANRAKLAEKLAKRHNAAVASDKPAGKRKPASDNGKAASKRVAAKLTDKPAKPTQAEREAAQRDAADARRLARDVAASAVAAFYPGASKPFKAAADRFADLNANNVKAPSARQAALMLALITYGAGNMRRDGTFTRGAFVVPAELLNPNAKPGDTIRAQPESGCLGNMLGRTVRYVSGPRTGREQSAAVFRLDPERALAEIQAAFGDKPAQAARKLLAGYPA